MADKYKTDLMLLQNEILGDIKNVENRIESKLKKSNQSLEEHKIAIEKKLNYLENAYSVLFQRSQNKTNNDNSNEKEKELLSKIDSLNKKIEDYSSKLNNKYNNLITEIRDSGYKYEKLISDSFTIPGLVGYKAPFTNIKEFFENTYKRLNECVKLKDQQVSEFKKYKEKLENSFSHGKNKFLVLENQINNKFELQIKSLEKKCNEKFKEIDEKIKEMKEENESLSNNLNDLSEKFTTIDEVLKNLSNEYKDNVTKNDSAFKEINDKLNKFEEQNKSFEKEIKLIKDKFIYIDKNRANLFVLDKKIKKLENEIFSSSYEPNKSNYNNDVNKSNNFELEQFEKKLLLKSDNNKDIAKNESNDIKSALKILQKKDIQISAENEELKLTRYPEYNSELIKQNPISRNTFIITPKKSKNKREFNRITSGKIFNHFPFISYDKSNKNDNIKNLNRDKNDSADIFFKSEEERNITRLNMNHKNYIKLRKKSEKESKNTDSIPNHKYNYLDKKIDILGRVMVDSFNKIIFRMNSFKKINNYNKLSVNKYKLSKALKKSNSFYQDISLSITPKLNPNFKSLNEENQ